MVVLAAFGGCVTTGTDGFSAAGTSYGGGAPHPPALKGAVGPWGEPVAAVPPVGPGAMGAMGGVGPEVALGNPYAAMPGAGLMPANHLVGGPGMGPGQSGVMQASAPGAPQLPPPPPGMFAPQGLVNAAGALPNQAPVAFPVQRSQLKFVGPAGAKVSWYVAAPADGGEAPTAKLQHALSVPGRYNFLQASIYRVKLSDIPGRPGVELYPTIEVVPANPKTDAFLAHNYIPVDFTEEDFDQIAAGNYITKVIYLPDAKTQSQAATGIEELVSTRLEPGVDPLAEAHRRGHILCVIRVGGILLDTPNSPPLDAPSPFGPPKGHGMVPMDANMAMQNQPMLPGLPGVSPGIPNGMPGRPMMMPPGMPNFNTPTTAPNGPMVPAPAGSLPGTGGDVQPMSYVIGPDGKPILVPTPRADSAMFPQTTIPPAKKKTSAQSDTSDSEKAKTTTKRKGLLDNWF
jgi:hypothetical protein